MGIFSWHYWLSSFPGPLSQLLATTLLVVFGLCIVLAVVVSILAGRGSLDSVAVRLHRKLQSFFATLGVVGFIILFFFWQQIPYLSSRYWLVIWFIIGLIWLYFIGRFGFIEVPKRRAEIAEEQRRKQYLPERKKKKKKRK